MSGEKRIPSNEQGKNPRTPLVDTPRAPNAVTIFGAGVAGLTVAHELVERGFQVQVWEPQADERSPERGCDVGGLARTQWGTVPWDLEQDVSQLTVPPGFGKALPADDPKNPRLPAVQSKPIRHYPYRFYIRWAPPELIRDDGADLDDLPKEVELRLQEGVRQFDVTIAHFGVGRLSRKERERRLEEIAASWAEKFSTQVDLLRKAGSCDRDAEQSQRWYSAEITLKYPRREKVKLRVALEDSLDPNTSTTTIVPVGPNASQLRPIVLRSRWRPGEVDCTIEDTTLAMKALGDVLKSGGVWYMEAMADMRALNDEEALRRATAIHATLTKAFADWQSPDEDMTFGELTSDPKLGLCVEVSAAKIIIQPISAPPYPTFEDAPQDIEVAISFRPRVRWLPGEHGYRFFPSFYHHLFDTMRRIPLLDLEAKSDLAIAQERAVGLRYPEPMRYVETGRTAFDNLNPTTSHVLASAMRQRPSQLARSPVRSLEELRSYLQLAFGSTELGNFGLSVRDVSRLTLKLLQFATSCEARRAEYGALSWWDYLDADSFSANAQDLLRKWPEALVAMNAEECDARTQWVPFIQLLLDQVRKEGYRDGTLRGPTSEAWLNPWRRYLEAQGVQFIHGKLKGFQVLNGEKIWPEVDCFDLRYPCEAVPGPENQELKRIRQQPLLRPGYFVVAVSSEQIKKLAVSFVKAANELSPGYAERNSDFVRAQNIGASNQKLPRPKGDLRHFAGIQFYFAEDVFWIDGHVYYPSSAWQLTSISQARFWQDRMDWEHGYRGVLSVIVGTWDRPGDDTEGKTAWECEPELLAREVWHQIRSSLEQRDRTDQERSFGGGRFGRRTPPGLLPEPIYWHLDQNLHWNGETYENHAPFYIARPGRFEDRPGDLENGYDVDFGFVLAGHHTKTYTRLPSMEGANESGRHAVNAILRHLSESDLSGRQFHGSFCDIWNPEDRELDDLQFFKELDERLEERGLPHVFESLDLDFAFEHLLRGGASDPLDPLQLLTALRRLYQRSEPRREASR
ncbi:MAG: hypothetical protein M3020_02630 [Myxococcota bacterium]|nr:hypothetical protein [Myxococcota bacterium]